MSGATPAEGHVITYRMLRGFRGRLDDLPLRERPTGQPLWHLYDAHAVHLESFQGDSAEAVRRAMRIVIERGDFGTGDWFRAGPEEYEFRLNNIGIALQAEAARRSEATGRDGE